MAHSSSKPAALAAAAPRLSTLSLCALSGALLALLLEERGAFAALAQPVPVPPWLARAVVALMVCVSLRCPPPARWRWPLAVLSGLALAGAQLLDWHARSIDDAGEGRVLVVAEVDGLPEPQDDGWRFTARLTPARAADATASAGPVAPRWPLRAQLRWRRDAPLHPGERWQFIVQLSALHPVRNPGQGAVAHAALRAGLHAYGQVVDSRLTSALPRAAHPVDRLRESLSERLRQQVAEPDAAALLAALAVGDTRFVTRQQWRTFNAVGITHLVAISGLHVTLFGVLCAALARRVWSVCPPLWRRVRREHCAALAAVLAATGYALLSGFQVPAQRTLLMLACWQTLRCTARPAAVAPALAVALLCVLWLDPLAPLAAGFWLSFVAVAVLMYALSAAPSRSGPANADAEAPATAPGAAPAEAPHVAARAGRRWLERSVDVVAGLWRTQWRIALGLLPVSLAVFGSTSLAGLAVNLVAIPVFSFVLVPLVLLSLPLLAWVPSLASPPLAAASWIVALLQPPLEQVAAWPWALWRVEAGGVAILLAVPAVWLLLLPGRWSQRGSALCALLPVCLPRTDAVPPGDFSATVLATGQSLSLVVRTQGHALLYDVGEHWGSAGSVSESVVIPALRMLHVRRLDRVVVPRLDKDRGAAVAVIDAAQPVGVWQTGGRDAERAPEFDGCPRGQHWQWDGVDFEMLEALACVLRISATGGSLLVADALDRPGQLALLAQGGVASDALILPRHGAGSAYVAGFRDAVAPHWAVAAQSARGAAAASVSGTLSSFRDAGAQVWVTGTQGAVTLQSTPQGLRVSPAGD